MRRLFATNVDTQDDDNFVLVARGHRCESAVEDDYTFGFIGDDGARLRILNQTFLSSTAITDSTGNAAVPAHQGDGIYWPNASPNSGTLGVVHLTPGDYNLELTYWESTGGSSIEVFAARGAKTAIDDTFQLIGNPAVGGLPLVRDPDTYPSIQSFTAGWRCCAFSSSVACLRASISPGRRMRLSCPEQPSPSTRGSVR